MGRGLEGSYRKALDADVEKDGAKEINWDNDDTFTSLFTEEELEEFRREEKLRESDAILKGLAESEQSEDYWYDAQDLHNATIDVPVQDKIEENKLAEALEKPGIEFQEISDAKVENDYDLQAELEKMADDVDGLW